MRHGLRVSTSLLALLFVGACTAEEPGISRPAPEPSAEGATEAAPDPGDIFAGKKACDLLDRAVQGQGFPAGTFSDIASDNGCKSAKVGVVVGLTLDDIQGIDELKADPSKKFSGFVHDRRSVQIRDPLGDVGACEVGMEVAAKARAVVSVVLGSNRPTDEACLQAEGIATAVEPELPKG